MYELIFMVIGAFIFGMIAVKPFRTKVVEAIKSLKGDDEDTTPPAA